MTGISKPTISDATERLLDARLIVHLGQQMSPQGRPIQVYDINADYGYVVGVSVERGHVAVRALDFAGAVLREDLTDTETDDDVSAAFARARGFLRHFDAAIATPRLAAAVSVAAPVDPGTSKIVGWPTSPFPDGLSVLGPALGIAEHQGLLVDNDVNWATFAEQRIGSMADGGDFVYLYLGSGVGAGLFLGGQVHRGTHGLAGEIAFTRLEGGEIFIRKLTQSIIGTHDGWGGSIDTTRAVEMFNDPACRESLQPIIDDIAWVLANTATVVDPGRIVIGGPLSESQPLIEALQQHFTLPSGIDVPIVASSLGRDSPLYGAAIGALDLARQRCAATLPSQRS